MTITNGKAFQYYNKLCSLAETGRLGFAIAKNRRKLEDELKEYMTERDDLIVRYGEQAENGSYIVPNEKVDEFMEELNKFDSMEFEFSPQYIDEESFCSGSLTSDQMYELDWMVSED